MKVCLRPISTEKKVSDMRKKFALLMHIKTSQFRSEEISLRRRVEVKSTFFALRFHSSTRMWRTKVIRWPNVIETTCYEGSKLQSINQQELTQVIVSYSSVTTRGLT